MLSLSQPIANIMETVSHVCITFIIPSWKKFKLSKYKIGVMLIFRKKATDLTKWSPNLLHSKLQNIQNQNILAKKEKLYCITVLNYFSSVDSCSSKEKSRKIFVSSEFWLLLLKLVKLLYCPSKETLER